MIRLTSVNLESVVPPSLPPADPRGPARLLLISATFLGFTNYHQAMIDACRDRRDLDAVFIELRPPWWLRVLAKGLPGGRGHWDGHVWRYAQLWRGVIGRWLRGPLAGRFDVVHVLTQNDAWALLDLPANDRPAMAVNIDATADQIVRELGGSRLGLGAVIRRERRLFEAVDLIVCRNQWCADALTAVQGLSPSKVLVARNSLTLPARSRLDHPPEPVGRPPRIVMVGHDFVRKGGRDLLAVHQRFLADRAELHICSGRARLGDGLRNVVDHGPTPRSALLGGLLAEMDIFCLPTRHDMHPWAVLEALASGLPVVASRLAGIPEMVLPERTGLLIEPGDQRGLRVALERLLDDLQLRRRMGESARRHVRTAYDPDRSFPVLMDRLVELATRQREKPGFSTRS